MGTCSYCGDAFPKTRATRKYCTPRCKTNACLARKPRRMRAADVAAVFGLLDEEFGSLEELQERLRQIVAPGEPEIRRLVVPRMD